MRARSLALVAPLSAEDCQAQSMPDASPAKWHLAHTTWFFETFVLERCERGFAPFDPRFRVLFNSYYNAVGEQHPRAAARPAVAAVARRGAALARTPSTQRMARAAAQRRRRRPSIDALVELGLHHEQQHQELLLTDIKHLLSLQPAAPGVPRALAAGAGASRSRWHWFGARRRAGRDRP